MNMNKTYHCDKHGIVPSSEVQEQSYLEGFGIEYRHYGKSNQKICGASVGIIRQPLAEQRDEARFNGLGNPRG